MHRNQPRWPDRERDAKPPRRLSESINVGEAIMSSRDIELLALLDDLTRCISLEPDDRAWYVCLTERLDKRPLGIPVDHTRFTALARYDRERASQILEEYGVIEHRTQHVS